MNLNNLLKKLAKSTYYQTIYGQEKNIGVRLFKNDTDLTEIQLRFLQELGFYSALYLDYQLGEVAELVFDSEIYEDSYMYYRSQSQKKTGEKNLKTNTNSKQFGSDFRSPNAGAATSKVSEWVFKTSTKKVK